MTDPALTGLPATPIGASDASGQETPWTAARWTLPRHGHPRHSTVLVDTRNPDVQYELAQGWLIPLDEHEQPKLKYDADGNPEETQ